MMAFVCSSGFVEDMEEEFTLDTDKLGKWLSHVDFDCLWWQVDCLPLINVQLREILSK